MSESSKLAQSMRLHTTVLGKLYTELFKKFKFDYTNN